MKKTFIGIVTSARMQKTVSVEVERKFRHHFYKKVITRHNKLKVHNEGIDLKAGDVVKIAETRPLSKEKHFIVIEKVTDKKLKAKSSVKK